ncbi:molecular chaperone TorD family protein [Sulfuritalea sp.]|uniref:molecular chaperone TorD family protein n=1 Tax=Sulfuritalea sp. TaxID=2480090 RepID=UPI001AD4446E|nr:molecular chaperone TorD family protein [Sulfuritalea sp.]MBN8475577.1 molecular chaperone TorD family protein [Sulfuritalea sp.]
MNEMSSAMNIGRIENAKARNRIYALLAMGFRYPDEEVFSQLADGAYADAIVNALAVCAADIAGGCQDSLAGLWATGPRQELEAAYISAFETNMPEPSISLYEGSHHLHGNKPELLLELKSFYRAFGLTMAEAENDLEDSLTAELEFMQFLTAKQVQAEDGTLDKSPYLRAQKDFLERHLAAWLPPLLAEAEGKLKSPFYKALIALANNFVALDAKAVKRDVADRGA